MSLQRLTVMSCDNQCDEMWVSGDNAAEVRREARAQGWRVSEKHGDLCPDCAAKDRAEAKDR